MLTVILAVIAFLLAGILFMPVWGTLGPRVYAVTKSHALQIAAMLCVFALLFAAGFAVLQRIAAFF